MIDCQRLPVRYLFLWILLGPFLMTSQSFGMLGADTIVRVTPSPLILDVGETSSLEVVIENPNRLFGFEFVLTFNPAIIQIRDGDPDRPGVQVRIGALVLEQPHFVAFNRVDNEIGQIQVAVSLLGAIDPIQSDGPLLVIPLEALADGVTSLHLEEMMLADRGANRLPATPVDGHIVVGTGAQITPSPTSSRLPTLSPTLTPTPTITPSPTATPNPNHALFLPLIRRNP